MNPIKRIIQTSSKYKIYYFLGFFFNILYSIFSIFSITAIIPVLSILFGTVDLKQTQSSNFLEIERNSFQYYKTYLIDFLNQMIQEHGKLDILLKMCITVTIAFFVRNVFRYLVQFFTLIFRVSITRDLQLNIYHKILNLPVQFFTEKKKGDVITRMFNDINQIDGNIISALLEMSKAPFMLLISLIYIFYIHPTLTLFVLIVLPIMGITVGLIGKSLKKEVQQIQNQSSLLLSMVDETINGVKVIKIFNSEKFMFNKFCSLLNRVRNLILIVSQKYELASPISEFLGSTTIMMIVYFGGKLIIQEKSIDPEDFLAFIALFFQMLEPAKILANSFTGLSKGKVSAERYFELLDSNIYIKEICNPVRVQSLNYGITIKNISFSYDGNRKIIDNISLFIPKGKRIALVGKSGSGKSTLVSLLTRFYDVSEGEILIDNYNIKDLKISDYRNLIGMVTQECILFNDTIKNNLKFGNLNISEDKILHATKISNSLEFIKNLPYGFETVIGELGGKISGGQKQRISIARAVLKNPPIMILDEATSALDTENERLVQNAIENLMKNRTSVVIAHRLSTIQNADLIVVMERGKIIEQGTHQELIKLKGKYSQLINLHNVKKL